MVNLQPGVAKGRPFAENASAAGIGSGSDWQFLPPNMTQILSYCPTFRS